MKKPKVRQKALSLFSREAVIRLRKEKFNGRLDVVWENGTIKDFNLKTSFRFYTGNKEDFFMDEV